jgi:sodium pump decarboxylase gamma subunit
VESIELILTGFGIVLGVLTMLWAVTNGVAAALNRSPKPETAASAQEAVPAVSAPEPDEAPTEHLAVISAAVASTFEAPHRIVSVTGPYAHVSAWTQQGLFEHFASHRMPWREPAGRGRRIKS